MNKKLEFDYYYGTEAEQFSFIRIPTVLVRNPYFKELSNDAKLFIWTHAGKNIFINEKSLV